MNARVTSEDPFADTKLGNALARAIVDTIHETFLVLDTDLRVVVASRSFYEKFKVSQDETQGRLLYAIGNGQWDVSALRHFLKHIVSEHGVMKEYKIAHNFLTIGQKTMMLSAREVTYEGNKREHLLLTIEDISEQELLDVEREKLSNQKDLMMQEMKHRMANSLQLIASIILLKTETVESKEVRTHLQDAHERIMSIATIEKYLDTTSLDSDVEVGPYLTGLCKNLAQGMTGKGKLVTLEVNADKGATKSAKAISLGLITAELVINALKHAFPKSKSGKITVTYTVHSKGWKLVVSDDGVGINPKLPRKEGLGTTIVKSLASQLGAVVERKVSDKGTTVSVGHTAAALKA